MAEAQRLLARLGYDPGPADGILGRRSIAAIREYRKDRGLPPAGTVDDALLERLRADLREAERRRTVTYRFASQPPLAEPGDVYVYSDGSVETVQRLAGPRVWWRAGDGSEHLAYANFLLPRWRRGDDAAEPPKIDADPDELWPDPSGQPVTFRVATANAAAATAGETVQQQWTCAVQGKRRIDVPAGRFDALVIGCERAPAQPDQWQRRTWYYSPALGHFVRRVDRMAGGGTGPSVELVAVRPGGTEWPPAARAGLDWALERALENGPDARPVEWTSSGVTDSFAIRVLGRSGSELGRGADCYSYMQERMPEGRRRTYTGLACRDPVTGGWTIPFLGPIATPLTPASR